ncbi:MAG TPA: hypothetical protein VGL86_33340 [Polyangia bacterium]
MARASLILVVAVALFGCGVDGRSGSGVVGQGICPTHPEQCGGKCCASTCTDVMHDPRNCGDCGAVCAVGTVCLGGSCGCPPNGDKCSLGQSCCGADGCVSLQSDIRNCGNCGTLCPMGATCAGGMCMCSGQPCTPMVDPVGSGMVPPGMCTCGDGCASDPTRSCIAMDCCYADYVAGKCAPSTSCGDWIYP